MSNPKKSGTAESFQIQLKIQGKSQIPKNPDPEKRNFFFIHFENNLSNHNIYQLKIVQNHFDMTNFFQDPDFSA